VLDFLCIGGLIMVDRPKLIGKRMRTRRDELGIKAVELAKRTGISNQTISALERGKRAPNQETLAKLAVGLKTTPQALLPPDEGEAVAGLSVVVGVLVIQEGQGPPEGPMQHTASALAPRPADLTDPDAYGVRILSDSMLPMFRPGMVVYVSPQSPHKDGDECYVVLTSGENVVRRVYNNGDSYGLQAVNPAYRMRTVRRNEVRAIHPIKWCRLSE
jgi:SOS-response transcriptional repressor LexA